MTKIRRVLTDYIRNGGRRLPFPWRVARGVRGVSLTELMVATAVMTTAVVGLMGSFLNVQKGIQVSKNKTLAANLVQEKMQILKQKNYYQVLVTPNPNYDTTVTPNIAYDPTYFPPETILEGGVTYTRYTYIQVVTEDSGNIVILPPATPDAGMRMITVSVKWQVGGIPQALTVNSILANPNTVMSNAIFNGTVSNSTNAVAIPGALVNIAENLGWRDTTNASGRYGINASPGSFTMVASAPGFFNQYTPVSIAANATQTVNFSLQQMSSGSVTGTAWFNPYPVISQVVPDTYTYCLSPTNVLTQQDVEYVELFNPTTYQINIGQTNQNWFDKHFSLWFVPENWSWIGEYNYPQTYSFDMLYVSSYIAPGGYFLYANANKFLLNGVWVTADAYYQPLYTNFMSQYANKAGYVGILSYPPWATGAAWVDSVRWDSVTSGAGLAPNWASPFLSTTSIPNCAACGNTALGSPKGNQIVRISSPSASVAGMTNFGHAYNFGNNQADWLYPTASFSGIQYMPHNVSSGTFTVVAGVPAIGAVVTATDILSDATTAYQTGWPPRADFKLTNVATATIAQPWTVFITTGGFTLENDSVTIAATGSIFNFPSSTTILNTATTQGFIAGTVTDVLGAPITVPSQIVVSPGGAGNNTNASSVNGRYLLRVTPGSVDVVTNPSNANPNYVSISSLSVTVVAGQISDGCNFILSQGGHISGYVTRDGVNALPGVAVTVLDANSQSRDTQVTDGTGHFTTITIATGPYDVVPELDSLETSSPTDVNVVMGIGQNVFASTFTISGALGTIYGSVSSAGSPISTGVLIVVTTVTLAGSPPAPPALSSATLTSSPYYITSSKEDGSYSVDVRQSTSPAYHAYAYYNTISPAGAVTIQSLTLSNLAVLAGQVVSTGTTFAW